MIKRRLSALYLYQRKKKMQIDEIKAPQFFENESGRIGVFLPAFSGVPHEPSISKKDANTLIFKRSEDADCLLTDIPEGLIVALSDVERILVVEVDLNTSVDVMISMIENLENGTAPDKEEVGSFEDMVELAYEVPVNVK